MPHIHTVFFIGDGSVGVVCVCDCSFKIFSGTPEQSFEIQPLLSLWSLVVWTRQRQIAMISLDKGTTELATRLFESAVSSSPIEFCRQKSWRRQAQESTFPSTLPQRPVLQSSACPPDVPGTDGGHNKTISVPVETVRGWTRRGRDNVGFWGRFLRCLRSLLAAVNSVLMHVMHQYDDAMCACPHESKCVVYFTNKASLF